MKKLLNAITIFIAGLGLIGTLSLAPAAGAIDITEKGDKDTSVLKDGGGGESFFDILKRIISLLMFVLGVVAVLAIIYGGFKFATANGDAGAVKEARNTVFYAAVGLVVAIMSYAIVNFVLGAFIK